eukprot:TRINITY_DN76312_c0_g1_i1.p1 TRINITY_DN76312_c0_g1~~TRINITY_DN76312_c0_g1_i1.p1  ORF type:complete len:468 (+),score=102.56 TRINITY_DN76312_c0_g1_i1:123-1406(+)
MVRLTSGGGLAPLLLLLLSCCCCASSGASSSAAALRGDPDLQAMLAAEGGPASLGLSLLQVQAEVVRPTLPDAASKFFQDGIDAADDIRSSAAGFLAAQGKRLQLHMVLVLSSVFGFLLLVFACPLLNQWRTSKFGASGLVQKGGYSSDGTAAAGVLLDKAARRLGGMSGDEHLPKHFSDDEDGSLSAGAASTDPTCSLDALRSSRARGSGSGASDVDSSEAASSSSESSSESPSPVRRHYETYAVFHQDDSDGDDEGAGAVAAAAAPAAMGAVQGGSDLEAGTLQSRLLALAAPTAPTGDLDDFGSASQSEEDQSRPSSATQGASAAERAGSSAAVAAYDSWIEALGKREADANATHSMTAAGENTAIFEPRFQAPDGAPGGFEEGVSDSEVFHSLAASEAEAETEAHTPRSVMSQVSLWSARGAK